MGFAGLFLLYFLTFPTIHSQSPELHPEHFGSLMPAQFQEQRSCPDVLILRGFAHTRDVQTPISYLWNPAWHRGVLLLVSSLPKGDCQQESFHPCLLLPL